MTYLSHIQIKQIFQDSNCSPLLRNVAGAALHYYKEKKRMKLELNNLTQMVGKLSNEIDKVLNSTSSSTACTNKCKQQAEGACSEGEAEIKSHDFF